MNLIKDHKLIHYMHCICKYIGYIDLLIKCRKCYDIDKNTRIIIIINKTRHGYLWFFSHAKAIQYRTINGMIFGNKNARNIYMKSIEMKPIKQIKKNLDVKMSDVKY